MLFDEERVHGESGVDTIGDIGHFGHLFEHDGIVDGFGRSLAPSKRSVVLTRTAGVSIGFKPSKRL